MAIAMKLHYVDVIQDNSLKNVYVNGKKDGYKFDIRLSCYRGHFLSLINELELSVDGEEVKKEDMFFAFTAKNLEFRNFMIWCQNFGKLSNRQRLKYSKTVDS